MFCKNCGKELCENAVICPGCGVVTDNMAKVVQPKTEQPESNGMAIAGFICSFFVPLLGWIFGGIGLSRSAKRNGKGKGFSIAALAIATGMFVIYLVERILEVHYVL